MLLLNKLIGGYMAKKYCPITCPICAETYDLSVFQDENRTVSYIKCHKCGSRSNLTVWASKNGYSVDGYVMTSNK